MSRRRRRRPTPQQPRPGTPPLHNVALVAAGGAVGAVARVALAVWFPVADQPVPWTTLIENLTGAFALALVLTLLTERLTTARWVHPLLCTGALGAFTTYSTLADELTGLLAGHPLLAAGYAAASLLGGLLAALAGVQAARAWPWVPRRLARRLQARRSR